MKNIKEAKVFIKNAFKNIGSLTPTLFIKNKNSQLIIMMFPVFLSDFDDRCSMMFKAGKKAQEEQFKIKEIIFVSECWMSKNVKMDKDDKPKIIPRNDPNRVEGVMCMSWSVKGKKDMFIYEIDRSGKKVVLKESDMDKPKSIEAPILRSFWEGYLE